MEPPDVTTLLRSHLAWIGFGVLLVSAAAALLLPVFGALVLATFVYYAARPVQRRLDGRLGHANVATAATLTLYVFPLLAVVVYGIAVGALELAEAFASMGLDRFRRLLGPVAGVAPLTNPFRLVRQVLADPSQALSADTRRLLRGILGPVGTYAEATLSALLRLFILFAIAFYMLRDDGRIAGWLRDTLGRESTVVQYLRDVDRLLASIYVGNVLTIVATAVIAVTTFLILSLIAPARVPVGHPVLLGLLVGVFTIIPAVGMKLVYVPYTAYLVVVAFSASTTLLWFPAVFFVVTLLVVDVVPDILVRSYASARRVHMGLIMFAYVLGSIAFGWYGIFLGPIVLAAIRPFARQVFPRLVGEEA